MTHMAGPPPASRGVRAGPLPTQPPQPPQPRPQLTRGDRVEPLTVQTVQERQRLLGLKEAAHLGPLPTRQQGQRQGDLLFRPGTVVQLTLGTKHRERTMGPLPARFGAFVLPEGRLGLLPGTTRRDRRAPGILALTLRLLDPTGGRFGLLPQPFHPAPTL